MTTEDEAKAQGIVNSWYWQMAEGHNFRWKNAVKSMVLYFESAPLESDIAQLVVEYLRTRESVTSLVIAHKNWTFAEPGMMAKDAWYQTVPGDNWAGTESKKVRVYWALVQAGDEEADGPYTIEDGCKYKVEHSYYWDVEDEPTLPSSASGVQYTIQGFTRDRETGLFTYIVEKRTTVQQDIALYESAMSIFETVSEEQHLGVKQEDVARTGLPASVSAGTRVERRITKNADCTSNIDNRKIEDHKQEGSRTVVQKKLTGTTSATTDRNLTPAEVATKTQAAQETGETRTTEKTGSDLRDLTIETFTPPTMPLTIAESCEKETSIHTDTKVELVTPPVQDGTIEQTPEANKRKTVTVRKDDNGKVAEKTTVTQTWLEKTGSGASQSGPNAAGNVATPSTTTVERKENSATTPEMTGTFAPGVNKVVEIEETPNDHGSKTTVRRVTEYGLQTAGGSSQSGPAAAGNVATPSVTTTTRQQNATSEATIDNADKGVNKVVEVDNQPNGMGGFNTVKRVTEYGLQTAGGSSQSGPDASTGVATPISTTTTRQQNATSEATVDSADKGVNKVVEVDNQPNGMGGFNTVKRVTTYGPTSKTKTWSDDNYTYQQCAYANQTDPLEPQSGETISLNFHPNGHGSYDGGWLTRTSKTSGGTVTLAWEKTISNLTSKYFYFNKDGKLSYRVFTCATAYYCYGPYRSCYNKVYESAGNPPENCAHVGWISGVRMSGTDKAFGQRFSGITAGSEVVVDS